MCDGNVVCVYVGNVLYVGNVVYVGNVRVRVENVMWLSLGPNWKSDHVACISSP